MDELQLNAIQKLGLLSKEEEALLQYNEQTQKQLLNTKPWTKDPQYFKKVWISASALLKLTIHSRSTTDTEIMGLLLGHLVPHEKSHAFVITDSFALPVTGTETRVNAHSEANTYMVLHHQRLHRIGLPTQLIGWYHSHPNYGCWLSGIDVQTQQLNQRYQEPWLAIVIDPVRTIASQKIDIGAFRTLPEGHQNKNELKMNIPMEKIQDFGVHCHAYYTLDIQVFKTRREEALLNVLWEKYWVDTLNSQWNEQGEQHLTKQMEDLGNRMKSKSGGKEEPERFKQECQKLSHEAIMKMVHGAMKQSLFAAK